jgi:hypothetical protein
MGNIMHRKKVGIKPLVLNILYRVKKREKTRLQIFPDCRDLCELGRASQGLRALSPSGS